MSRKTIGSISRAELVARLSCEGIVVRVPPFVCRIQSTIPIVSQGIEALYGDYELLPDDADFADFHVSVRRGRRLPRPLCVFEMDGVQPFTPLAIGEAFALLEWGLNWCITGHCHTLLTIHSAVLERDGRVLIMPAPPGAGKSTLCAALNLHGWRLLSDEMTLLDPETGMVVPSPRPISLKNKSIEVIRQLDPEAVFGPVARDTVKGTVVHMRPPSSSVQRATERALPAWVVFPKYVADAASRLIPREKAESFMQLAENSFNQNVLGRAGFDALSDLIARSDCYDFSYGNLREAIDIFASLPLPQ